MAGHEARYDDWHARLTRYGQQHLLAFWAQLSDTQRSELLADLAEVDFDRCAALIDPYVRNRPHLEVPAQIEPPSPYPSQPRSEQRELYARAVAAGERAIAAGEVAAFTVAGGQGTRLGYDGPKGEFRISPVRHAPLFQLFAESLRGIERRYGRRPHWYIMTSPLNDGRTRQFFAENRYWGLDPAQVTFFPQRQMPAFLPDGRTALAEKHRLALGPDGHGGSLRALAESGALERMRRDGVKYISYFQVDNPLVRTIDPLFVGLHAVTGSEMSSKAVTKAGDLERVGNFCVADGKLCVIEYSDLPESLAVAKNPDGSRRFDAGSIAIHILSREFVERLTAPGAAVQLPWHRADKKVTVVDESGRVAAPSAPNVVKLEMFVFDAIPLARNPLVLMTPREEEFSPVKNAEGADSPATTRRDMIRRATRWLEAAGWRIPRRADGEPDAQIEISPAFALDAADLAARNLKAREVGRGENLLLE